MELVSAIITTHGRLDLLKLAIKSVQEQTYPYIEIIVVDDCSKDGTKEWFKDNKDASIKYIYIPKEQSKGGNHARNIGIKEASGKYLAFLDDDDEWLETKIEKQVQLMKENSNVGLVYCGHTKCYENGNRIDFIPSQLYTGNLSSKVFTMVFCTTSMILVKKSVLNEAGLFDENLSFWQEYDLVIRICQCCEVQRVPEVLVNILHSANDPSRLSSKIDGWLNAVEYVNEKYKKELKALSHDDLNARQLMIYNDAANRCAISGDMKRHKEFLRKAWKVDNSFKHYIKYKLNITNYKMDRFRQFMRRWNQWQKR